MADIRVELWHITMRRGAAQCVCVWCSINTTRCYGKRKKLICILFFFLSPRWQFRTSDFKVFYRVFLLNAPRLLPRRFSCWENKIYASSIHWSRAELVKRNERTPTHTRSLFRCAARMRKVCGCELVIWLWTYKSSWKDSIWRRGHGAGDSTAANRAGQRPDEGVIIIIIIIMQSSECISIFRVQVNRTANKTIFTCVGWDDAHKCVQSREMVSNAKTMRMAKEAPL